MRIIFFHILIEDMNDNYFKNIYVYFTIMKIICQERIFKIQKQKISYLIELTYFSFSNSFFQKDSEVLFLHFIAISHDF